MNVSERRFRTMTQRWENTDALMSWPLSAAQQGVWVAQQLDPGNPRYNCGGYLEIHGAVDPAILECAVHQAVLETEALRVRFVDTDEGVRQCIEAPPQKVLHTIDVSGELDPQAAADAWMKSDLAYVVDLASEPLFNHVLFIITPERSFFYLRYHHIVMDGFGQTRYWSRVGEIYSALATGTECVASPFGALDAVLNEDATYRVSPQFSRDQKYWLEAFADRPEPARLSGVVSLASRNLLRRTINLEPTVTEHLRAAAQRTASRWSVLVIAATAAYMQRLTGVENVVLGLPVTSRMTQVARDTPCMMANELPLRLSLQPTMSLGDLLRQVSGQVGRVLMHQRYRGEDLHHALKLSGSDQKLIGPVVNVISFDHHVQFGAHETTAHYLSSGPITDLLIGFYGKSDGSELQIFFDANPELYSHDDLVSHQQRFLHFLNEFLLADADLAISQLDLLRPGERAQLDGYNATERVYDLSKCLHELIDEQAQRTPDATAIAVADGSMTYREMIDASNRLAAYLRQQGVVPGQRVGVFEVRSLELVVDLLAIMKAGAAYVPLDPELPMPRLEYQLDNAEIKVVLSRSTLMDRLASFGVQTVAVDHLLPGLPQTLNLSSVVVTPDSAAYVIYTSGSTGQPKGVAVPHKGVVNRLLWMQEAYCLETDDCVLQKTPFTFDVSVWEFFWPLMAGCRLFLAAPEAHRDPHYVAGIIREQAVTTLHFVPPMLDLFLGESGLVDIKGLRRVVCSGEALHPETVQAFFDIFKPATHGTELYNLYGPTEASIDVTAWRCRPEDAHGLIPIGYPVANTQIYLLDISGTPTPVGVPGEIYIGGAQVALGYVNRPELSAERFLSNPFAEGMMYRTGDLARYRKDGAIEFLGRLDHQIKLRGFRIELGEIETTLLTHPAIKQTVVTVWDRDERDRRLVAYVVLAQTNAPAQEELMTALPAFLSEQLPEYMVPAHIVVLEALPLLLNGKIDRRALPEPQVETAGALVLPSTPNERLLHKVWRQVLGTDQFGVEQSFFALGGDSMLSIRMRTGMEQHGYTFLIQDLFSFSTIRTLAKHLHSLESVGHKRAQSKPFDMLCAADRALLPTGLDDAYPLSAMQGGMLFHAEFDNDTAVYRVVTSLHIAAEFDPLALQRAIADTFRRHPALRSSYDLSSYSEPLQLVHSEVDIPFEIAEDLGDHDVDLAQRVIKDWVARAKFHHFDVAKAPLLSFTVHRRGAASFQLSVVEHHVVLDGWSDAAMLEEIVNRYHAQLNGEELWLQSIPSSYRDFIAEERRVLGDIASRQFWNNLLHDAEPTLLPRKTLQHGEQQRSVQQAFDVPLSPEIGERLHHLARREGLPLKALLATAHVAVLRLVCNTTDVVTGIVSNGRLEEAGGDEVIGVFLNTLPLRLDTTSGSLLALAHQVFAGERDGAPHRRYPFVQIQRDLGGQLQLDSYVNFMDFHLQWQMGRADDAAIVDIIGVAETNIPLAVNFLMDPIHNRLRFWLDCDVSLLDIEFCQRLIGYYQRALQAVVDHPEQDIAMLDLLGDDERQLIARWNDTAANYDAHTTVHEQIALQAARSPDAPALAYRWQTHSYAQLDARANQLAHQLRRLGVRRGSLVGVCLRRSAELVVALLAVMKAGGAYVPLDPTFPKNRLDFIAGDAAIDCLVTDSAGPVGLATKNVLLVDLEAGLIDGQPGTALIADAALDANGDDPAYVIYTSGSTGLPKGTVIRHRNVINFFAGMDARIGCTESDTVLALTSVSFDISVLELLWPLVRGAKVVVVGEHLISNLISDGSESKRALTNCLLLRSTETEWCVAAEKWAADEGWLTLQDSITNDMQWLAGNSSSTAFERAAASGISVITPLLGQTVEELGHKISAYRSAAVADADGSTGRVTVVLPCFILEDADSAQQQAYTAFREYLFSHVDLHPFRYADGIDESEEGYFSRSGLFGSPSGLVDRLRDLIRVGVDAIAYQLDFGLSAEQISAGLPGLKRLVALHLDEAAETEHSFAEVCTRQRISIMQSTPSFLAAVVAEPLALASLQQARAVLVGGEVFPVGLAERLLTALPSVRIFNMYGPTETTIWSTVHELDRTCDTKANVIPIGTPIANTEVLVLDAGRNPVPIGVAGELWIGGDGVAGLYLGRPDLTAERFPPHPKGNGLVYRTGDRVRWRRDGVLEFLGRVDRQVKILGYRVEPDEVESVLSTHPQVAAVAVVAVQKESGSTELVAFAAPHHSMVDRAAEESHVLRWGEVWEGAYSDPDSGAQGDDPAHDFAGWISSYDDQPIPEPQMREWLACAVKRVDALLPHSVLDVGVGVGLFMREFAPRVDHYIGLDVSKAALCNAAASLKLGPTLPAHIKLIHGDAGYLEEIANGAVDTVILNSVIQYFPGTAYLERVLLEASRVVGQEGAVFVGDVRDVSLLEAFHATSQLQRAPALMLAHEISAVLERQLAAEGELCLATGFFRLLAAQIETLAEPRLEIKRGHAENELSCFRFDVVLLGRSRADTEPTGEVLDWAGMATVSAAVGVATGLAALEAKLQAQPVGLTVSGIPNQRLVRPLKLVQLLREAGSETTAWDLEKALWEIDDGSALDPELVAELAERHGYRIRLLVPEHGHLDQFDAVFERSA